MRCGSVDAEKLVDELNEKLRVAPAGGKPAPEKDKLWVPQPHFEKVSKDVEQVHITMGMPGYDFCDPRKYAMSIVCSALGGSMSSSSSACASRAAWRIQYFATHRYTLSQA